MLSVVSSMIEYYNNEGVFYESTYSKRQQKETSHQDDTKLAQRFDIKTTAIYILNFKNKKITTKTQFKKMYNTTQSMQ